MGNRGILHDNNQVLGPARWRHKAWVTCVLKWTDWHRPVMAPGAYTELFFLDEAVALAAGHRPCALCRNGDYKAFRAAAEITTPADEMDRVLHAQRAIPRRFEQRRSRCDARGLPDGTVILDDVPKLLMGDTMFQVGPSGYGPAERRVTGEVTVLTPQLSRLAMSNGYRPVIGL